jgi:sugar phosphate permease
MSEPNPGPEGGWNAARALGMIVGVLGMVGFGFCSLCGLVMGFSDNGRYWEAVAVFVSIGIVLTFLFFLLVRAVLRRARRKPSDASGS